PRDLHPEPGHAGPAVAPSGSAGRDWGGRAPGDCGGGAPGDCSRRRSGERAWGSADSSGVGGAQGHALPAADPEPRRWQHCAAAGNRSGAKAAAHAVRAALAAAAGLAAEGAGAARRPGSSGGGHHQRAQNAAAGEQPDARRAAAHAGIRGGGGGGEARDADGQAEARGADDPDGRAAGGGPGGVSDGDRGVGENGVLSVVPRRDLRPRRRRGARQRAHHGPPVRGHRPGAVLCRPARRPPVALALARADLPPGRGPRGGHRLFPRPQGQIQQHGPQHPSGLCPGLRCEGHHPAGAV
ncbi:hypothetical protein IWQ57_004991, partial [Coemansia nantahalensis]